jgi:hypothetical protein
MSLGKQIVGCVIACVIGGLILLVFLFSISPSMEDIQQDQKLDTDRRARILQSEIAQAIRRKSVIIGMTKEQAVAAWGKPDTIDKHRSEFRETAYWHYPSGSMLVFEADNSSGRPVLTHISTTRTVR